MHRKKIDDYGMQQIMRQRFQSPSQHNKQNMQFNQFVGHADAAFKRQAYVSNGGVNCKKKRWLKLSKDMEVEGGEWYRSSCQFSQNRLSFQPLSRSHSIFGSDRTQSTWVKADNKENINIMLNTGGAIIGNNAGSMKVNMGAMNINNTSGNIGNYHVGHFWAGNDGNENIVGVVTNFKNNPHHRNLHKNNQPQPQQPQPTRQGLIPCQPHPESQPNFHLRNLRNPRSHPHRKSAKSNQGRINLNFHKYTSSSTSGRFDQNFKNCSSTRSSRPIMKQTVEQPASEYFRGSIIDLLKSSTRIQ